MDSIIVRNPHSHPTPPHSHPTPPPERTPSELLWSPNLSVGILYTTVNNCTLYNRTARESIHARADSKRSFSHSVTSIVSFSIIFLV
jgi:hypothetical protein